MRKIFIDCGAHNGDTIEQFFNWIQLIDNPLDYKIYGFEPNPRFLEDLKRLETNKKNVKTSPYAVWTREGEAEFTLDLSDYALGSSLMRSKVVKNARQTKVHTIDLSEYIAQFEGDEVILKLDVEGAEFEILRKMIIDGTIMIPKLIFCEFHPNKVLEYTTTDKNNLIDQITSLGIKIMEWH